MPKDRLSIGQKFSVRLCNSFIDNVTCSLTDLAPAKAKYLRFSVTQGECRQNSDSRRVPRVIIVPKSPKSIACEVEIQELKLMVAKDCGLKPFN